jgi:excisionase family DNA binding protein
MAGYELILWRCRADFKDLASSVSSAMISPSLSVLGMTKPNDVGSGKWNSGCAKTIGSWMDDLMMEDRWLSVDEIAAYLGIKRDTVYKWIDNKDMPAHKVGRLWKFKRVEVDEWVRQGGASQQGIRGGHDAE